MDCILALAVAVASLNDCVAAAAAVADSVQDSAEFPFTVWRSGVWAARRLSFWYMTSPTWAVDGGGGNGGGVASDCVSFSSEEFV